MGAAAVRKLVDPMGIALSWWLLGQEGRVLITGLTFRVYPGIVLNFAFFELSTSNLSGQIWCFHSTKAAGLSL